MQPKQRERITTPNDFFWGARHLANTYRLGLEPKFEGALKQQGRWEETKQNLEMILDALAPYEDEEEPHAIPV